VKLTLSDALSPKETVARPQKTILQRSELHEKYTHPEMLMRLWDPVKPDPAGYREPPNIWDVSVCPV
jgi:hypothetical protein